MIISGRIKVMTRKILALCALWLLTAGASAPVRMTPVKITDGVYMFQHSQGSGNSTAVITNDGVLVLDFHIDNAARAAQVLL
jgi:hypothetical protein